MMPPTPPPPKDLPEVEKPKTTRRFVGSTVPVTTVHVPRQITQSRPLPVATPALPAPSAKQIEAHAPAAEAPPRPLFAKVQATKQKLKTRRILRVGQRERLVLASLFVLILIAVGIAAIIFLPHGNITLALQTAPLLVDERLRLVPDAQGDPTAVAGTAFYREVNLSEVAPVTSREVVGAKATGTVELVNRTSEEQKIRERSRLVTKDGVLFYMTRHAIIPAADGPTPSRVSVAVEADQAGEAGNITPQRLNFAALDSGAQSLVYAENAGTFTGGTGEEVAVVKAVDIEAAKKAAQDAARNQTEEEAKKEARDGWVILQESWTTELTTFETTAKEGDRASSIPYTARATVRVMGYEDKQMQTALNNALRKKLDSEYMLFPGPISFTKAVESVDWDKPEAIVAVRITHTTVPNISLETLRDKLVGRNKAEALAYVQGLKGVRSANIELWPFWVTSVPSIEKRVDIKIEQGK